jgi:predicted AlkP superfamily pyrophosphatase or phosphodiesterase
VTTSKRIIFLAVIVAIDLVSACRTTPNTSEDNSTAVPARNATVVLISIDGYRSDYYDRYPTPTLRRLASEGVRSEGLIPAFPSKTFPNHYTIVTGLYPAHHGIVGNTIYDPEREAWFRFTDDDAVTDPRWWGGEPIWVTAERQGVCSASFFWPGSEAPIGGIHPSYWRSFDSSIPGTERVADILSWLDLPSEERPRLITAYFGAVDHAGHEFGPDSPEVRGAIAGVDRDLALLVAGIEERGLRSEAHVILVSDHGMAATSPERVVILGDIVDAGAFRYTELSPVAMLEPRDRTAAELVDAFEGGHPHLTVLETKDLPVEYNFGGNPRIPPVLAIADEGWLIESTREHFEARTVFPLGMHGYDPRLPSMHGLFIAWGPAIAKGETLQSFENVHVYELLCYLLGLDPAPNDGDLHTVAAALAEPISGDRD